MNDNVKTKKCTKCGANSVKEGYFPNTIFVPITDNKPEPQFKVGAFLCEKCGYIELYAKN